MSRIFSLDNPVVVVLTKIFDVIWLSLLYSVFIIPELFGIFMAAKDGWNVLNIILCLPALGLGAATTALYYVSAKVIRKSQSYVWREFKKSFLLNFRQSTIYWVVVLCIYFLLAWNVNYLGLNNPDSANFGGYLPAIYMTMIILMVAVTLNVFPIISRFDNKLMTSVKFALYCCFRHFLHTLAIFLLVSMGIYVIYMTYDFAVTVNAPMLLAFTIFLPGLICWLITFPMEHVLKKYQPKNEDKVDSEGHTIKMWYEE